MLFSKRLLMPRAVLRLGQVLLIMALLSASGAQWIALQSLAWGTMFADFSRTSRWTEAVQKTFDGQHPCALCKSIEQGKKSEKKAEATVVVTKLDLFHQAQTAFTFHPGTREEWPAGNAAAERRFEQPPLRPPRLA